MPGDGLDTTLARLLLRDSVLAQETLKTCLDEVRSRRRGGQQATLAGLLLSSGLVPREAVERAQAEAGGLDDSNAEWPAHGGPRGTWVDRSGTQVGARLDAGDGSPTLPGRRSPTGKLQATIGGYRVVRELARGGMGAVYEVESAGGGRFALKTILAGGLALDPDDEFLLRFRKEGELLARLDHPHIVRVHAAQFTGETPFMVQDLLPGENLEVRLRGGPLPQAEAVGIVLKIADALRHAHERGVLHRDLKPENIMFDDRGEPRLVDFGIGVSLNANSQRISRSGTTVGTPAYMPPEQALGFKEVDARSDVYGLGATLYALLSAQEPFKGSSAMAVLEAVVNKRPADPSSINQTIGRAVADVVLRALEKEPAHRYPDMGAFAAALRAAHVGSATDGGARGRDPLPIMAAVAATLLSLGLGAAWLKGGRAASGPPMKELASRPGAKADPLAGAKTPPPPPPPPQPKGLWELERGTAWRGQIQRESWFQPPGVAPRKQSDWRMLLAFEVQEKSEDRAVLSATIEKLRMFFLLTFMEMPRPVSYDSWQRTPEDPSEAKFFQLLEGARLRIVMDPRSGEVLEVSGINQVRDAVIVPAARVYLEALGLNASVLDGTQARALIEALDDDGFRRDLNQAFHCVPPGSEAPSRSWEVSGHTPVSSVDYPMSLRLTPTSTRGVFSVKGSITGELPSRISKHYLRGSVTFLDGHLDDVEHEEGFALVRRRQGTVDTAWLKVSLHYEHVEQP